MRADRPTWPLDGLIVKTQFFDIPRPLKRRCNEGSDALRAFYRGVFVTFGMTRGEVDFSCVSDLRPGEIDVARELVRRNLDRGYTHLIEAAAALGDQDSVPILRALLGKHPGLSWRLTISGSLWRLGRDPVFLDCIAEMVESESTPLKEVHLDQVLWIGDERAIRYLIRLLDDPGRFVRYLALSRLNELEHSRSFAGVTLPTTATEYKARMNDQHFIETMTAHLQLWLADRAWRVPGTAGRT